jgi:dolichyl-phosphate-mannose--protein O-mannosyl transferase
MTAADANPRRPPLKSGISDRQTLVFAALFAIMLVAVVTRFYRLGEPDRCYFDEVYFPTTAVEILKGDDDAWQFFGHENTHPPLSKELMALGMALPIIGGHDGARDNSCWPDAEDDFKRANPDWIYDAVGWRFFGALAGVGAVFFMYLLAKRLFENEVAALASAALLTFDGLALAQARIGTPDTYVLFFTLGSLYFLTSNRFLLSGLFFGAAAATKWIGAFTMWPIVLYLVIRLIKGILETEPDERMKEVERVLKVGAALMAGAVVLGVIGGFLGAVGILGGFVDIAFLMAFAAVPGLIVLLCGLAVVAVDSRFRSTPRGSLYLQTALAFPLFFIIVPFIVYSATYIPMLMSGYSVGDAIDLNRSAYEFHSGLTAPHSYASDWWEWPIMKKPIYFFAGSGEAKIYGMGNPAVFWLAIPALLFVAWQSFRLRARLVGETGRIAFRGAVAFSQWPLFFVVLSFLGVWLPWSTQPRVLFIYHYLPALTFAILALGYCIARLWYADREWGRWAAVSVLALVAITFAYFFPHLTAIDVPRALDESYFWFKSWR